MSRAKYTGRERKLLLAFDVGTTYSGISYSILDPGNEPKILSVQLRPERIRNAKIPSILYYDKNGRVCVAGAETEEEGMDIMADEEGWVKAKWFKLHLRPKTPEFATGAPADIPKLPPNKTAVDVFSDFLEYLNAYAKQFIEANHPGIGTSLWNGPEIHYVLSHPNGWGGPQQTMMKRAAEKAGLIRAGGRNKLSFITEGEASLNRCIDQGLMTESIRRREGVSIVDAGGGTLDISAYAAMADGKGFEEIAEAQCHIKGSIFVTDAAEKHLNKILWGSQFAKFIDKMKQEFDTKTKCLFENPSRPQFIRFGNKDDMDLILKIRSGALRLDGTVVASFFEPSIKCIVDGVLEQRRRAHRRITSVFLVGGFSENEFLLKRVKEGLEPHGLSVFRPLNTQLNKIVADGAVSFALDHPVLSRVTRYAAGTEARILYKPNLLEHSERRAQAIVDLAGNLRIPRGFDIILPRNTQVLETKEFRSSYSRLASNPEDLKKIYYDEILCYRGKELKDGDKFIGDDPDNYHELCQVKVDARNIPISFHIGPTGSYYKIAYEIVILFGATELKAQVAWQKDGIEKRGDAGVIYETDI
ncbi:hypothetical protein AN958_05794 [Leucoagaricus sp. SymC.cos]|nr:hypothetical protein AN958_05794 [Leucoagaricus sp. SymC.cos]